MKADMHLHTRYSRDAVSSPEKMIRAAMRLFVGRLLWGLAWVGIWVGGNTIIMDISDDHSRGRWVGFYQIFFFLGASGGSISGGVLTDWLGYHQAMAISATLTLLGAVMALQIMVWMQQMMVHCGVWQRKWRNRMMKWILTLMKIASTFR